MTTPKPKRDNSVLFFVLGVLAVIVGIVTANVAANGDAVFLIGCGVTIVGVVLLILAFVQYGKNIRTVARVVVGAAVKVNDMPGRPTLVPDQIARLVDLHDSGSLSDEEFALAKAKVIQPD